MNVSGVSVKEVVEMIESRIPGGRYVTSILICLLLLTVATASGIYLYHALVLPLVLGISSLLNTGKVPSTTIGAVIGSAIGSTVLIFTFRYMSKSTLDLQKQTLDLQKQVLAGYKKFDDSLGMLVRRLETIETRVSALENQDH